MDVLLCVNDSCGLNNCYSIKCNKQQEKYCFSRANIFTSGDIELNPGPANAYMLLQSRLAQQGLSTLDVGGVGDCFFRAVSHQLVHKQSPDGGRKYHSDILGGSVLLTLEPLAFSTACLAAILQPYSRF